MPPSFYWDVRLGRFSGREWQDMLKILGAISALLLGLWWGRAGRYARSREEVDEALGRGNPRNYPKRHFTPLDLLRKTTRSSNRGLSFKLRDPGAKPEPEDGRPTVVLGRLRRR